MNEHIIKILVLILFFSFKGNSQTKSDQNMIALEKIEEIYNNLHNSGVDTDSDMLYGYFFTDSEPKQLEQVSTELKEKGFNYVDLFKDEEGTYWLHLERIEKHNSKSLFELNKELYKIAIQYKITSYDGFDVGNVDNSKPIERDTYIVPEEFGTNNFVDNGTPFLVVVNKALENFTHKNEFYFFIEVTTKYKIDNSSKLPTQKEFEELDNFELFLENNLIQNSVNNYYVGRTTHNEKRIFYFITDESEGAQRLLKLIKEDGNQREYEYLIIEDKEWKLYENLIEQLNKE